MRIDVVFSEESCEISPDFGEVHNISDGGYERGYADGYNDGKPKNGVEYVEVDTNGNATKAKVFGALQANQFYNNKTLLSVELPQMATVIPENFFYACTKVIPVLPPSVHTLGNSAFRQMPHLTSFALHEGIKEIGNGTFYGTPLEEVIVPSTVEKVDHNAFGNIKTLKTAIFLGTPKSIGNCFTAASSSAITDIYVPWAEGEVANAPWGAGSQVTVHYNHQGDII